jgi:hypothetical protein
MNKIQEAFAGYKTYILAAFLLVAEVVNITESYDVDITAIRAVVVPLVIATVSAKLNRNS